jgi:diguanylate cyclase (GGDEF)-like protein/putative nucleotidyltransferase with HDIG domain
MPGFAQLKGPAKAYVVGVVLAGAAAVAYSTVRLYQNPLDPQWIVIAALTLLTGSFSVKIASINARISVSEAFVFLAVLLFGAAAGTITVLLEALTVLFWMSPAGRPPHRLLFNLAAPTIAIWVSATVFFLFSGIEPYSIRPAPLSALFLPLAGFTTLYFFLNSWLVAVVVGLETKQPPLAIWWEKFVWLSVTYFSSASVAALIVTFSRELDVSTLAIIGPLLLVSYLTFRTAMGRVEDSNKHLSDLNRLYLSTIETLAMAIDAKDQITHGHIRRVQTYAVGLAKRVGVIDQKLIKAIEAAALLHDMGKLAVPEYILNKPGRLSPAEFEKMKLHASVGADILSAIDFPYPVVPIVRHHHESWDGSGYPAGLKSTDIPIGARILSVVDCFDALTSDRPYRPRLSNEEAIRILIERRGSMYDPLIVDTFIRVHADIAPEVSTTRVQGHALNEITGSIQEPASTTDLQRLDDITASADEMLTLYELARALAGQASISDTGDVIAKHLRRLIPFAQSILFLLDPATDELEAKHATGAASSVVKGLRIPLGRRLSGWVGANQQTIVNSDPTLDLGDVARTINPRLRSCLSTPLTSEAQLVGVLTLYSEAIDGFNEDHRRVIEVVARQISHTLKCAVESDSTTRLDSITGLPNLHQLEQLLQSTGSDSLSVASELTLVFIDVVGLKDINAQHGRQAGDDVLRHVVRHTRTGLRVSDVLFRNGSDQFVALLNHTNLSAAKLIAERIQENILEHVLPSKSGSSLTIQTIVTCVSAPRDGASFRELMAVAQSRIASQQDHSPTQVH